MFTNLFDTRQQADRLLQLGIEQYQSGQKSAAIDPWKKALKLYRQISYRLGEGQSLANIALSYYELENYFYKNYCESYI